MVLAESSPRHTPFRIRNALHEARRGKSSLRRKHTDTFVDWFRELFTGTHLVMVELKHLAVADIRNILAVSYGRVFNRPSSIESICRPHITAIRFRLLPALDFILLSYRHEDYKFQYAKFNKKS